MRIATAVAILSALFACAALAQVFKWTDAEGRIHYGDQPPQSGRNEKLNLRVQSYEGPAQVTDWSKIIRDKSKSAGSAAAPSGVVMYSTSWCPHCKRAKVYFAKRNVSYQEIDVESSESGKRAFDALGGGGVPLILVNGKAMRGFDEAGMEQLLAR